MTIQRVSVSIIIPTKNSAKTLKKLLTSINCQTLTNFETIVVDSYSEDGTEEVAKGFNVIFVKKDLDRAAARNFGASLASSDTLLFLDSDMELSETVLEECATLIGSFDALCLREEVLGNGYWSLVRKMEKNAVYGSIVFEACNCFRRCVFEDIAGYNSSLSGMEDMDVQFKLLQINARIGWVKSIVYHHEENISLIAYLLKKKGRTFKQIAELDPQYWKILRSPLARIRTIFNYLRKSDILNLTYLIPGLIVLKSLEFLVRIMR